MYLNFVNTFQCMEVQELVEQWAEGITDYVASVKAAIDTIQITFYMFEIILAVIMISYSLGVVVGKNWDRFTTE